MNVRQITTLDELEALVPHWQRLAQGQPFLSPAWLLVWWRHFGARWDRRLAVLVVSDERNEPVAIAPWYLERSRWCGPTLRFLGSGAVCTDYLSFPCRDGWHERAADAIADWLCESADARTDRAVQSWELLSLEGVDAGDLAMRHLCEALDRRGAITHVRPGANCWRLSLPASWEDYLALLSKSHRKRVRRLERAYFQNGRAQLITAKTAAELDKGFQLLVDLHAQRWATRGERGAFGDSAMCRFHLAATAELLSSGQLRLAWLELDGKPVAAEYSLIGDGTIYAYQSGMAPDAQHDEPGNLALIASLRSAIDEGYRAFDFLRGDEEYKLHWRPEPRAAIDVRVLPNRLSGRVRQTLWQTASSVKGWLRTGRDAIRASSDSLTSAQPV